MSATFFDTNVLVYATLDQDVAKKRIAATLISDGERYGAVDVVNPFKALSS